MSTTKSENWTTLKKNETFINSYPNIRIDFQADNIQKLNMETLVNSSGIIIVNYENYAGNINNKTFNFSLQFNLLEKHEFNVNRSNNQVTTIKSSLKYVVEGSGGDTHIHLTDNVIFHFQLCGYISGSPIPNYYYEMMHPRIEVKSQTTI